MYVWFEHIKMYAQAVVIIFAWHLTIYAAMFVHAHLVCMCICMLGMCTHASVYAVCVLHVHVLLPLGLSR